MSRHLEYVSSSYRCWITVHVDQAVIASKEITAARRARRHKGPWSTRHAGCGRVHVVVDPTSWAQGAYAHTPFASMTSWCTVNAWRGSRAYSPSPFAILSSHTWASTASSGYSSPTTHRHGQWSRQHKESHCKRLVRPLEHEPRQDTDCRMSAHEPCMSQPVVPAKRCLHRTKGLLSESMVPASHSKLVHGPTSPSVLMKCPASHFMHGVPGLASWST
jgi:hypothetical protein